MVGLLGGAVASIFSIGPLLLALIGYDVARALALSSYWPHTVAAGLLLLAVALITFGKKGPIRKGDIAVGLTAFFLALLVSVYAITPLASPIIYGVEESREPSLTILSEKGYRQLSLQIEGMVCPGCAFGIQSALQRTQGIVAARVSLPDKGVVIYDPQEIMKEQIVKLPIFSGVYSAKIVEDVPVELVIE